MSDRLVRGGQADVEMHAWQYGLGWMGRGGRCMHGSMVWGGWPEVGDACMAAWLVLAG